MAKGFIKVIVACAVICPLGGGAGLGAPVVPVEDLSYEDRDYLALSETTVASKNRMIRKTRNDVYAPPTIYIYTLKTYEDIWTIIAKTSLNIDTIATLNRLDFIGTLRQGVQVLLPGLLGLFFEAEENDPAALARRFNVGENEVLVLDDPLRAGGKLFFLPETELSFLERSYLSGVVFHAPLMGAQSSGFGQRFDPFVNEITFHGGVDIAAPEGKVVRASRWGTVLFAGEQNGYGKLVIMRHELGYYTLYGHMKETLVSEGENVETGQALGSVGSSGKTTGPHLHFEIRRRGKQLDPEGIPFLLDHGGR